MNQAWQLLAETAGKNKPEWKKSILDHARIVHDLSLRLADLFSEDRQVDVETVQLGAVLHDVGRSRADRVVEHGIKSGEMLREEGFPEGAARIAETHVGVGITPEQAASLGLPEGNYIPETLEERIVCYADNLLNYLVDEGRHELVDRRAVVKRFSLELGEEYGKRAEDFMTGLEMELGPERFVRFRRYVEEVNERLQTGERGEESDQD
ncbi:MAG: HDIG domain-containing protein [Deltaproteobacteria bacterium]|nr:HDIG domain-containing protein [Deltaproteobacteria bacterium]